MHARDARNDGRVHLVQGPMCHWRLSSTGDGDEQRFVRGKTRWTESSSRLAALLARKHGGENRRVRKIGQNEMIVVSMYSPKFVNERFRVLGKQLIDDGRVDSVSLHSVGLNWIHENDKKTISKGNLLDPINVQERKGEKIEWVLKQKLFDYVPQSVCTGRHLSTKEKKSELD